jgi:hypothetical protein
LLCNPCRSVVPYKTLYYYCTLKRCSAVESRGQVRKEGKLSSRLESRPLDQGLAGNVVVVENPGVEQKLFPQHYCLPN